VRVLMRVIKKVGEISGPVGTLLRDRTRSIKLKVLAIARASRNKDRKRQTENEAGFTGLEMCLSVLRWLLDVINNVNFHDALLRFHSQTQLSEHLKHREPVGDVG
jgi:hypothetical protein